MEGFFSEIGPFIFLNSTSKNLTNNQFSWVEFAHLLFIETPSKVGKPICKFAYQIKGFSVNPQPL
jgi:carboxypeptidase C (cathepsin A)